MSKLIKKDINDLKDKTSQFGLEVSTFEDQVKKQEYPVVYVDISNSSIEYLEYEGGVLRVYTSWDSYKDYNLFSKTLCQLCDIVESEYPGVSCKLLTPKVALVPVLQLSMFSSRSIMKIDIDKSPVMLSDYHPDILSNISSFSLGNPSYLVIDAFNEDGPLSFQVTGTNNLFVDDIGTAIVQHDLNRFYLLAKTEQVYSTKTLLNYALENDITKHQKELLVSHFLESHDMYGTT